jgi:hypothetical protein
VDTVVVLARIGGAELAALIGALVFVLIMAYLLFGGAPKKDRQQ